MTTDRTRPPYDVERLAAAWLAEGPTELADRVVDAALREVHVTRQRRVWEPWKTLGRLFEPTNVPTKVVIGLVLTMVAISGAYLVGFGGGSTTPGGHPSASAVPSETTRGAAPTAARLDPGHYQIGSSDPTLSFDLTVGWVGALYPRPEADLTRPATPGGVVIAKVWGIHNFEKDAGVVEPAPGDLMGWLASHPNFIWDGPPKDVSVAGLAGAWIEGHVRATQPPYGVLVYTGSPAALRAPWHVRYYVMPLPGYDLTVLIYGETDAAFAALLEDTLPLLNSLEIGTVPSPTP